LKLNIYTDGSSRGNPGPGGYAAILKYGKHIKEISAGFKHTTNNRMELLAVIAALEALKQQNLDITVYTDSKYVCDAIEKGWLNKWIANNFKKVKNPDLWVRYFKLSKLHKIKFIWIKGHNNHPENERCDYLATQEALTNPILLDEGFEQMLASGNDLL